MSTKANSFSCCLPEYILQFHIRIIQVKVMFIPMHYNVFLTGKIFNSKSIIFFYC